MIKTQKDKSDKPCKSTKEKRELLRFAKLKRDLDAENKPHRTRGELDEDDNEAMLPPREKHNRKKKLQQQQNASDELDEFDDDPSLMLHNTTYATQKTQLVIRDRSGLRDTKTGPIAVQTDEMEEGFKVGNLKEFLRKLKTNNKSDKRGAEASDSEEDMAAEEEQGQQQLGKKRRDPNLLKTLYQKETKKQVDMRKKLARQPLDTSKRSRPPWRCEEIQDNIGVDYIDMPKRPNWDFKMTKQQIDDQEEDMMDNWISTVTAKYTDRINYFEHNLEVWRQLWRVCERSDIIALITDSRFPLFHFPPSLYNYVVNDLKKHIILVLNKIDLISVEALEQWQEFFREKYPSLKIVSFSSFQDATEIDIDSEEVRRKKLHEINQFKNRKVQNAIGARDFLEAIKSFQISKNGKVVEVGELINKKLQSEIDDQARKASSKDQQVFESLNTETDDAVLDEVIDHENMEIFDVDADQEIQDKLREKNIKRRDQVILIGMVGHPNVGKSSLINGLVGKKVVSTSSMPGKTKHFQTIYLTQSIQLCDCPGLIFPAIDRPKPIQILCGLYPLANLREPYTGLRYLAERLPLEDIYALKKPEFRNENEANNFTWSPWTLAEAMAVKRSLPESAIHAAGLEILKDCVDGRISISWLPPSQTTRTKKATTSKRSARPEKDKAVQEEEDDLPTSIKKKTQKAKKKHQKPSAVQSQPQATTNVSENVSNDNATRNDTDNNSTEAQN